MRKFVVGDVVCLKSGGHDMTVAPFPENKALDFNAEYKPVLALWHDEHGVPHEAIYPSKALSLSS